MNHTEMQEKLWSYYDDELPAAEQALVLAHTAQCAECREQLASWKETRDRTLTPLRASASDAFVHSVMRRVRGMETSRVPFYIRWAMPALAFSAVSFAASLFYVLQPASASAESLLWADHSTNYSAQWLAQNPSEDQILNSVVTTQ